MMETVQRLGLINLVTSVLLARKQEVARTITRINRQKKNTTDTYFAHFETLTEVKCTGEKIRHTKKHL